MGGLANRAACVGAERKGRLECGDGRSRTTTGTAGNAVEIPRVMRGAIRGVLGGGPHGELVHVGLAEGHKAGLANLRDDRGVVGRHPPFKNERAARGGHVGRDENVFDGQGHAIKSVQDGAGLAARIRSLGGCERHLGVDVQEGMNGSIDGRNAVEVGLRYLNTGGGTGGQSCGEFGGGLANEIRHYCSSPRIAETLKRLPSCSGACVNTCAVSRTSATTSSR